MAKPGVYAPACSTEAQGVGTSPLPHCYSQAIHPHIMLVRFMLLLQGGHVVAVRQV